MSISSYFHSHFYLLQRHCHQLPLPCTLCGLLHLFQNSYQTTLLWMNLSRRYVFNDQNQIWHVRLRIDSQLQDEASWMVSVFDLATLPGCLLSAWLMERFGRKQTLLTSAVFVFVPWILIIFAKRVQVLYVARIIAGVGSGIISTVGNEWFYHNLRIWFETC